MNVTDSDLTVPSGAKDVGNVLLGNTEAIITASLGTYTTGCACGGACCGDTTDLDLGTISCDFDDAGTPVARTYTNITWEALRIAGTLGNEEYVAARARTRVSGECNCIIRAWFGKVSTGSVGMASLLLRQGDLRIIAVDWDIPDVSGQATYFGLYQENDSLTETVGVDGGASCDLAGRSVGDSTFGAAIENTAPLYTTETDPTTGVS